MSIFDTRKWPDNSAKLKDFGNSDVKLLFNTYKIFFNDGISAVSDSQQCEDMVLQQWVEMKAEINNSSDGLATLKFHALWARMLLNFSDEYPLVLRLVVLMLLIPCDTSECERIFSLMNDIKTAERSSLEQQNLKNLMLWHFAGKGLSCEQVYQWESPCRKPSHRYAQA